ncbi:hypothetical protein I203_102237 [Kwoniella mangroviensis CBS 8507]|uniref:uncharacterized protein n=1 Tax=Kwoniella mangroviensis CBS 8507 TaxID=1296122 RepID=UPI00080D8063|nr:uncharacterized protein I203_03434 [Kwoniella mangroviensis CBS 8507]OCF67736.1 hypothetical protein I203_03434 [Kwoniella mangroviensis CBS 8507]
MLCDPASRPQSPFLRATPTHSPHIHHQSFYPTPSPGQSSSRIYPSYPTPPTSGSGQLTPIPSLPQHQQSCSVPPTPSPSQRPTFSQSHSLSQRPIPSSSSSFVGRPSKPLKKSSGSTNQKQKNVQMSLELKVEKAKGFHAFFVPLCKNLPPPPPCSPVNGHPPQTQTQTQTQTQLQTGDYFGQWNKAKSHDQWVEDISNSFNKQNQHQHPNQSGGDGMEVDAH